MYNHKPKNYDCPFCLIIKGIENNKVSTHQSDIIYKDKYITVFVASHWWPNNKGHVIIIPNKHFENIYDLPDIFSDKIHRFEKKIAKAIKKSYKPDGVSLRQHNEPAGGQDVWHYHQQIFPRYNNDRLYQLDAKKSLSSPKARLAYAKKLRKILK